MKIKLPSSLKVLSKQLKVYVDLRSKNAQLKDVMKFVGDLDKKLQNVSNRRIQILKQQATYSIYFNDTAITSNPWIFVPGQPQEEVNRMKLEILRELGY